MPLTPLLQLSTRRSSHHSPASEQLRKQAKELLATVPRRQILTPYPETPTGSNAIRIQPTVRPDDAQRVLSRAYGYESWAKFKAFRGLARTSHGLAEAVRTEISARKHGPLLHSRPEIS